MSDANLTSRWKVPQDQKVVATCLGGLSKACLKKFTTTKFVRICPECKDTIRYMGTTIEEAEVSVRRA